MNNDLQNLGVSNEDLLARLSNAFVIATSVLAEARARNSLKPLSADSEARSYVVVNKAISAEKSQVTGLALRFDSEMPQGIETLKTSEACQYSWKGQRESFAQWNGFLFVPKCALDQEVVDRLQTAVASHVLCGDQGDVLTKEAIAERYACMRDLDSFDLDSFCREFSFNARTVWQEDAACLVEKALQDKATAKSAAVRSANAKRIERLALQMAPGCGRP